MGITKEEVISVLHGYVDEDTVIEDAMGLFSDLKLDSLRFMEFVAEIEERIGKEFVEMSVLFDKVQNVGELAEYIVEFADDK